MQRFANWSAWLVVAVIVALSVVNWETLMIAAPLNLLLLSIDAPLGLVLVGALGLLTALFFLATLHNFLATLHNQIGALRETSRLNKEINRLQSLVDQSQLTMIDTMRMELKEEFGALHRRFDLLPEVSKTLSQPPETILPKSSEDTPVVTTAVIDPGI